MPEKILVRGPEQFDPAGALQKLFQCCVPKRPHATMDDETTQVTHATSASDSDYTVSHSQRVINRELSYPTRSSSKYNDARSASQNSNRPPPELKATMVGRKPRVLRGLGVALVGLLAVFVTLWTLHQSGYPTADFALSRGRHPASSLINVQYRKRAQSSPTVASSTSSASQPATTSPSFDEMADEKLARAKQLIDELRDFVQTEIKAKADL